MQIENIIPVLSSDSRSMFLWTGSLKDQTKSSETCNKDDEIIKDAILNKLEILESNLLSITSFLSDIESANENDGLKDELLAELKDNHG